MDDVKLCAKCGINPRRGRNYCITCGREYHKQWEQKNRSKKTGKFLKHRRPELEKEPTAGTYEDKGDKLFTDLLRRGKERLKWENKRIPKMRGD